MIAASAGWSAFPTAPGACPVGTVLPYAGPLADTDTGPPGLNLSEVGARLAATGWLACDGRALPQADYPLLYGVIGCAFGGDARSFNLPDLRGRFVRGVDGTAGRDPSAAARTSAPGGNAGNRVGSLQADAYQGHEHDFVTPGALSVQAGEATALARAPAGQAVTTGQVDDGTHGAPRVDAETRPLNIYLNHIIRAW